MLRRVPTGISCFFLGGLDKSGNLQPPLDFAIRQRPKPHQPRPLWCALWAGVWLAAARNGAPAPLSDCLALPVRFRPDWRHQLRGIARRTNLLRAKLMRQMDGSFRYSCTGRLVDPSQPVGFGKVEDLQPRL